MASDEQKHLDDLRHRMQNLRVELHHDVHEVVNSTRDMTDWKTYVRRYPWACIGVAAGIGFLIVPTKSRTEIVRPSDAQVLKLAKQDRIHINTEKASPQSKGLLTTALMFVASAAVRSAVAYAGQNLGKAFTPPVGGTHGTTAPQSTGGSR